MVHQHAVRSWINPTATHIFARLLLYFSLLWGGTAYAGTAAQLTSPSPGSTFTSTTVNFSWTAGSGVEGYHLYVGSTQGGADYFNQSISSRNATVQGLPSDGRMIYARLWSRISGSWYYIDYDFRATSSGAGGAKPAEMSSPKPGSTLSSGSATFSWTAGSGVSSIHLYVGSSQGGNDLFNQAQGSARSVTIAGLPTDGRALYVRLWSYIGSAWNYRDYNYTALKSGGGSATSSSQMTSPSPGATLPGSSVAFGWTAGTGVSGNHLYIGNSQGGADIFNQSMGSSRNVTVSGIPVDGRAIYARLWSLISGSWEFRDYSYTASRSGGGSGGAVGVDSSGYLKPSPPWMFIDAAPDPMMLTQGCCSKNDHDGDDYYAEDWDRKGEGEQYIPIRAPYKGTVIFTATNQSNVTGSCTTQGAEGLPSCYGNQVILDFGNGVFLRAAHLNSALVSVGQVVEAGTWIGYAGNTGKSLGQHAHLVFYQNVGSAEKARLMAGKSVMSINNDRKPTKYALPWNWASKTP